MNTAMRMEDEIIELYAGLCPEAAQDRLSSSYYVCEFSGYVSRSTFPEHCPICTAPKKRFLKVAP